MISEIGVVKNRAVDHENIFTHKEVEERPEEAGKSKTDQETWRWKP